VSALFWSVVASAVGFMIGRARGYGEGFAEGDRLRMLSERGLICTQSGCNAEVTPGHYHCANHAEPDVGLCSGCRQEHAAEE